MATTTVHPSVPLAHNLIQALRSRDEDQVVAALRPILGDTATTADVLLTFAAMQGVPA